MHEMNTFASIRSRSRNRLTSSVCLMLALQFVTLSDSVEASNCLSASGETAVKLCKSELARSPGNLNAIMAMSEALISLRKYADAVKILKDGLARNPRNSDIKRKLALAQSYVEEKSFIERRRADAKLDAMTKRNVIRCKALSGESALEACNEALELKHSDPALYSAKGDVLLDMGRYVESILAYRKALRLAPEDTEVSAKLKTAALKRKNLVNTCKNDSGAAALSACDAALLNGEPDQFIIQKKKAELLLAMGRKQESIRAYREALELEPGNKIVKNKIYLKKFKVILLDN